MIKAEGRLRAAINRAYIDPKDQSEPIYDGVVDPDQYACASPRIMWMLKEPYDDGRERKGGGWSLTELLKNDTDRMSRQRAFQPICYICYGIWSGIADWNIMPWLRDSEAIRNGLKKIVFINVSKLPGLKSSSWGSIAKSYEDHRILLLDQINTYGPNLIFACDPHVNLIARDLGISAPNWKWFGSAAVIQTAAEQRLVWVGHPSQRTDRAAYVNDAIRAATSEIPKFHGDMEAGRTGQLGSKVGI
ncbi:MAG TPA: hypothetical protein VN673_00480 [Clostridia bacterium]|nr:hypothetical protein [Clostridia bacterium]